MLLPEQRKQIERRIQAGVVETRNAILTKKAITDMKERAGAYGEYGSTHASGAIVPASPTKTLGDVMKRKGVMMGKEDAGVLKKRVSISKLHSIFRGKAEGAE